MIDATEITPKTTEDGGVVKSTYAQMIKAGEPVKSVDPVTGDPITVEKGQEGYQMHTNAAAMSKVFGKPISETIKTAQQIDHNIKVNKALQEGQQPPEMPKKPGPIARFFGFGKSTPAPATTSPTPAASAA